MRTQLTTLSIALILLHGLHLETGFGQSQSAKEPSKAVLMTSCLVKGDEPGEVWLAQKMGESTGSRVGKLT